MENPPDSGTVPGPAPHAHVHAVSFETPVSESGAPLSAVLTPQLTLQVGSSHGTSGTDTHSKDFQSPGAPDPHAQDAAGAAQTSQLDSNIDANITYVQQQQQQQPGENPSPANADDLQLEGNTVPINALASPGTMNKLQQLWTR